MLEGLEIKEKQLSNTLSNKDFRIDSDFWTKEPVKNPKLNYSRIGDLIDKAQYGISIAMNENGDGYPIYRMNEIHNMHCDLEVLKFADVSIDELATFKLNDRDVLFNRTNSYEWVGRTGLYRKADERNFIFASYLVRFLPKKNELTPEYLTAFLNTLYGISDIKRRSRHSINQTNVNPEEVKEIEIPILSMGFQLLITKCFDEAHKLRLNSRTTYTQAETLLLETLGLKDFQPSTEKVNVKSFQESFGSSGRLDAEYYQVKYEDYYSLVTSYECGYEPFVVACTLKDKNYKPEDKREYKYIEIANIGKSGDITGCTTEFGKELPTRARRKVNTNDVVVSSIEGSLDSCALVTDEYDNALCSTGFYVVESEKLNPETLLVLFKSEPMQALLKKGCSGTILTAIGKPELEQIPIPLIDKKTQSKIKEQIEQSFQLKNQSEHLLEVAKTAVEMAIEQDEDRTLEWLKRETKAIDNSLTLDD